MKLSEELKVVEDKVCRYFPEALKPLKTGIAVVAILTFKNNAQPTSLIFSGDSGSGKTLILGFILPDENYEELLAHIYRCDNFTPKAFVSHAANVKAEKLKDIDLLPKIEGKVLITKELAPIFRGSQDELIKLFSILISVLDGRGYISSSGMRGTRGYDYPINFCWLGATTPLTTETHKLMSQLGTRLLFYNTNRPEKSFDELLNFAKKNNNAEMENECKKAVNDFLTDFFEKYPVNSFDTNLITFDDKLLKQLVVYTKMMAILRASFSFKEIKTNNDGYEERHGQPQIEKEERAIIILKNIALGSALIHGRNYVNDYDISQIRHIALSSMPEQRRITFEALLKCNGYAETKQIVENTNFSKATALHYMKELGHLGICKYDDDGDSSNIELDDRFDELINDQLSENEAELGEYFKNKGGV